jgi:hypothetical protein
VVHTRAPAVDFFLVNGVTESINPHVPLGVCPMPKPPRSPSLAQIKSNEQLILKERIRSLEVQIDALNNLQFEIAIIKGGYGVILVIFAFVISLFGIILFDKRNIFSGTDFDVMVAILTVAALTYFSFVFGRRFMLSLELSKAKKQLNLNSGDRI